MVNFAGLFKPSVQSARPLRQHLERLRHLCRRCADAQSFQGSFLATQLGNEIESRRVAVALFFPRKAPAFRPGPFARQEA
jgi:hypothetical protein